MTGDDRLYGIPRPSGDDVVPLLSRLVAIDSVNPSLVPGSAGEGEIASFVAEWLEHAGLRVEIQDVAPGRPNVIGHVPGRASGRSLMLNAHMDTVGVVGMDAPFDPRVEDGRLYGRGSYDMKSGLAAIMLAAQVVAQLGGADGDVVVTAVMDEEYASLGTQEIVAGMRTDAAIVTEPTSLRICAAHKGFAWMSIQTLGRSAHGSKPNLGIDAIAHMGRVLQDIEVLEEDLATRSPHPLLGHGSIHASLIEGGQELSSYPERCRLQVERRTLPGERAQDVMEEVDRIVQKRKSQDVQFDAQADLLFWREPFEVALDRPIVQTLSRVSTQVCGVVPDVYGDSPWMDAALLASAGIPTVVFGPGGEGAHSAAEYASIYQVALCAQVLAETALDFCQ